MKPTPALLPCCALLLASLAPAQTTTWIAPASGMQDWFDGAHWDTGIAPNDPAAIALFTRATDHATAPTSFPGGAMPVIEGATATVDSIRFALPEMPAGQTTRLSVTNGGQLVVQGAGIILGSTGTFGVAHEILVGPGGDLALTGGARVQTASAQSGQLRIVLSGNYTHPQQMVFGANLRLSGTANLGPALVSTANSPSDLNSVRFSDTSSAGSSSINLAQFGNVAFHDRSTADGARISAYNIDFHDESSAGHATLGGNPNFALPRVRFSDRSNAGSATINLGKLGEVSFGDDSDAGTATVAISSGAASATVSIGGRARTAGLSIVTALGGHGTVDIANAAQDVTLRVLNGLNDVRLGGRSLRFTDAVFSSPGAGDSLLAGRISGTGGITWQRTARLTISNPDNTYTGVTRINLGQLFLDQGRIADTELTDGAASLIGHGVVAGQLRNAGAVSPRGGILTVQGNYLQTTAGVLSITVASPVEYDRLVISGNASLTGFLNVSTGADLGIVGNTSIEFLTAGSVGGTFSHVNVPAAPGAALSSQLQYTATGVRLAYLQHPFAGLGTTPAGSALGAHLDATLGNSTGAYRNLIARLNVLPTAPAVATALDALAADRYSVLAENGFAAAAARLAALDRRLALLDRPPPTLGGAKPDQRLAFFFEAGYRKAGFDAVSGLPAAHSTARLGTAGGSWRDDAWLLGASLSQEKGRLDLDALGSRADLKSLTPAVFFRYAPDRFFLHAAAAFSQDDYDLQRRVVYAGVDQAAQAAPSGRRTDLAFTAGYPFPAGHWRLTPQAGVLNSTVHLDSFTETGAAAANLAVAGFSVRSTRLRAGLDAVRPATGRGLVPRLAIMWLHELQDARAFPARFSGAGVDYTAPGRAAEKDLVQASLSVEKPIGRCAAFQLTLGGARGRNSALTSDLSLGFHREF